MLKRTHCVKKYISERGVLLCPTGVVSYVYSHSGQVEGDILPA